jgi:predicted transglutaminase-like cysteine proteinase
MIARINSAVNAEIAPATDREMWGIEERWDFPINGRGDCEDYVLLKRARLMAEGFPRQALLITVVTDLQGDGHAVLTLKTDRGDFILDNMNDDVKLWRETPYGYVKRQSQIDQNGWVSLRTGETGSMMVSR